MDSPAFRLNAKINASPGIADSMLVMANDDTLTLSLRRESPSGKPRGGRDLFMDLDRSAALALGRHLVSQASRMTAVPTEKTEPEVRSSDWAVNDCGERFLGLLSARAIADEGVLFCIEQIYEDENGRFVEIREDVPMILNRAAARSFARSLLAVTG